MAVNRTTHASPSGQFHGYAWKVQRLPRSASTSAPTFSIVGMPALSNVRCAGFHSGNSPFGSRPVTLQTERRRERMIHLRRIDRYELDTLVDKPLRRFLR